MSFTVSGTKLEKARIRSRRLPNGLGSLKVTDAMCYVFLAFLVIGSTWGYTSDDSFYLVGTALGMILGVTSVLTKAYTKKELVFVAGMLVLSIMIALVARSLTLLLTTVVIASSKGMKVKSLLTFFLAIKILSLVSLLFFGWLGLFDTVEAAHYSALLGGTVERVRINDVATNILHLGLFTILMLFVVRAGDRLSLLAYAVMMAVNVAFYFLISYSSGGLLVTTCAIVFSAMVHYSGVARKILCRFSFLVVPITVVLFLYTGFEYDGTGWIAKLNHLTTGRIAYNHYWLTAHGITLFGVNPAGEPAAFDNSVVYLLVGLGVFAGFIVLMAYCSTMRRLGRMGETYQLLLILMFYLFSMSESILPSIVVNPSIFVVVSVMLNGFYQSDFTSAAAAERASAK